MSWRTKFGPLRAVLPVAPGREAGVLVRPATGADAHAIWRLAHRDSRPVPHGQMVVAEVDGELIAAVSVADGTAIAEPFRHTAHIVRMLRSYAGLCAVG